MKKPWRMNINLRKTFSAILTIGVIWLVLLLTLNVKANELTLTPSSVHQDSSQQSAIQDGLVKYRLRLNYPHSVSRFYKTNSYQLAFIYPQSGEQLAWNAMLLLDCIPQYGLNPADYHPLELLYGQLNRLIAPGNQVEITEKVEFDMLLVDAMITLINNLHFGKLNPHYTPSKLDAGNAVPFYTEDTLAGAIRQPDFVAAVENLQPHSKAYIALQGHLRWLTGRNALPNDPEVNKNMRIMAVNMERLRWMKSPDNERNAIEVNIPAQALRFRWADSIYIFKASGNLPEVNIPVLQGYITRVVIAKNPGVQQDFTFLIMGEGKCSLVSATNRPADMRNDNNHPTGTIRVVDAQKLAELLLAADGSGIDRMGWSSVLNSPSKHVIHLQQPLPVQICYLTCQVQDGELTMYPDIYQLDQKLYMLLFDNRSHLSVESSRTGAS